MTQNIEERVTEILTNIRKIREERGLGREALASKLGFSKDTIYHLEKGSRTLSLKWLIRLSEVLDVSFAQLLGEKHFDKNAHAEKKDESDNKVKGTGKYLVTEYMSYAIDILNNVIDQNERKSRDEAELLSEIYKQIYDIYEKNYAKFELVQHIEKKKTENLVASAIITYLERKIKSK